MLLAGGIACALGLLEFFLDTVLFAAVFKKAYARAALTGLTKLAVYGLGIAALMVKFRAYAVPAAIGFGAGFLVYMVGYGVFTLMKKDG